MAATWRRMVCPTEATDCSASLSGSASLTATSVMAEAMRRSSCARQTSSARNQKMTIGTRMATAAVSAEALPSRPDTPPAATWVEIKPKAKKPPMMNQSHRSGKRDQEGRARRALLKREDQPADRGNVVIGRRGEAALRGRARGAPRAHELRGGVGAALGPGASANSSGGFGGYSSPRRLGGLRRLFALRLDDRSLALALLGLEPFRQGCSLREFGAPLKWPSPDFSSRDRVIASRGFCSLAPAAALPDGVSLALAPSRVPRNRRKLMREFARPATRYPPAAARSVIERRP